MKWILLHQRDRFLPLKVIKEYLSTIYDEAFADGNMPNFDFEGSGTLLLEGTESSPKSEEVQTDRSHLTAVPNSDTGEIASVSSIHASANSEVESKSKTALLQEAPARPRSTDSRTSRKIVRPKPTKKYDSVLVHLDIDSLVGATESMTPTKPKTKKRKLKSDSVLSLEAMTIETGISGPELKELVRFGVLEATGTGNQMVFHSDEISMALVVAPLLDKGIEVRHIKNYALFAAREVGFLEHIVQDDLRKKNPQSQEIALEKAKEFIQDTARLREMLLLQELKKEIKS